MIYLALHLCLVRFVDAPAGVSIASEETERNVAMLLAVAVDVLHTQRDDFRTRHASELSGHAVSTEGDRADGSGTADNRNLARGDGPIEREDSVVAPELRSSTPEIPVSGIEMSNVPAPP